MGVPQSQSSSVELNKPNTPGQFIVAGLQEQIQKETNPLLLSRMKPALPSISPRMGGVLDESQQLSDQSEEPAKMMVWDPNNHPDLYMKLDVPSYSQLYNEVLPVKVTEEAEKRALESRVRASREGSGSSFGSAVDPLKPSPIPDRNAPFRVSQSFSRLAAETLEEMEDSPNVHIGMDEEASETMDTPKTKEKKYLGKIATKIMNVNRLARMKPGGEGLHMLSIPEKPAGSKIVLDALKEKPRSAGGEPKVRPLKSKRVAPVTYSLRHNQAAEIAGKPLKPVISKYHV